MSAIATSSPIAERSIRKSHSPQKHPPVSPIQSPQSSFPTSSTSTISGQSTQQLSPQRVVCSPAPQVVRLSPRVSDACLIDFQQSIPPERIGLDGQYDYYGLTKRVKLALKQAFEPSQEINLKVTQRGRVVIFAGKITTRALLQEAVYVAMHVDGTDFVETRGVLMG